MRIPVRRAANKALLLLAVALVGCQVLFGYESSARTHDSRADVGTASDSSDSSGGAEAGGGGDGCDGCALPLTRCDRPGRRLLPIAAFYATPGVAELCGVDNAVLRDGRTAGIDRPGGVQWTVLDGEVVSGCIGLDYGQVLEFRQFVVRAASAAKACSVACVGQDCGSSDYFRIYTGTTKGRYSLRDGYTDLVRTLADYTTSFSGRARYVVICRGGGGITRDDVLLDAVTAVCR